MRKKAKKEERAKKKAMLQAVEEAQSRLSAEQGKETKANLGRELDYCYYKKILR